MIDGSKICPRAQAYRDGRGYVGGHALPSPLHKSAPYKISSVHIAFARKLLAMAPVVDAMNHVSPYTISMLAASPAISTVGIFRALVQCERGEKPSPADRVDRFWNQ